MPIFKKFNSSIVRDVPFTLIPTPGAATGMPDYSNQNHYTTANHNFTQIPLAFNFVTKLPELPRFKGTYVDGVAIIGGASAPGRGVVPLGIGVGVNTTPLDGQVDRLDAAGLAVGTVGVRMAPTHHGIEGAHYGLLMAAISAKGLTDASAGIGASALFPRLPGNKLVFDPAGATPNVNVIRVSISDDLDTRWDVLVDAAAPNFTLPLPPGALRDRIYSNGNAATGDRGTMVVQAFRMVKDPLTTGSPAVNFNAYVELNDTNADRTTDFLTAFSFLTYAPPSVGFKTPSANPATITAMSKLVVTVSSFAVGTAATDDGVVKFSFTPNTGCPDAIVSTEAPMKGSGEVEYTLPAGCTGMRSIKAELLKSDMATPIAPAVSKTITATIN